MSQTARLWLVGLGVALLLALALYFGGAFDGFTTTSEEDTTVVEVATPEPLPNGRVEILEARVGTVFSANSFSVVVLDVAGDSDGTTNGRMEQFVGRTIYVYSTGHEASCGLYHFDASGGVLTGALTDGLIEGEIIALDGVFDNASTGTYPGGHLVVTCEEVEPISNN